MPGFSIIIPVYNVEDYLDQCVESVLSQTYRDFELILVDDGSPDRSGAMCDRWAEKDARVTVIHKKNGGLSSARNRGIEQASGDYLLFLDSDDYWITDQALQTMAQRLSRTRADVLIFNIQKEYEGVREKPYFPETLTMPEKQSAEESVEFVARNGLWTACAWNKVISKRLFSNGQLFFREGITSEDIDWCVRVALAAERFDYLGLSVVNYRQRVNSITGSVSVKKVDCLYGNIQECVRLLEQAKAEKAGLLRGYVAYQYGTFVFNIAGLPASDDRKRLKAGAKELSYVLEWSDNTKIALIRRTKKLLGFSMTLRLLSLKGKLDSIRKKRSD